jgi:hypothetical protein
MFVVTYHPFDQSDFEIPLAHVWLEALYNL